MKSHPRRFLLLFLLLAVALPLSRAADVLPVVPIGDDTYLITAKATHKFTRNTQKLKDQALGAATQFCAKEGRQLQVVSVVENKSQYLVGDFAQIVLTFRAVSPDDLSLASTAPEAATAKGMSTDVLRSELTKLDEMRKQGLLNDKEFEALRQKVLDRF